MFFANKDKRSRSNIASSFNLCILWNFLHVRIFSIQVRNVSVHFYAESHGLTGFILLPQLAQSHSRDGLVLGSPSHSHNPGTQVPHLHSGSIGIMYHTHTQPRAYFKFPILSITHNTYHNIPVI